MKADHLLKQKETLLLHLEELELRYEKEHANLQNSMYGTSTLERKLQKDIIKAKKILESIEDKLREIETITSPLTM